VVAGRERVQVPVPVLGAGSGDDRPGGGGRDAATLERGQDAPPGLVDRPLAPAALPVADDAGRLPVGQHDREHLPDARFAEPQVPLVPVQHLGLGLRPAEVRRHLRRVRLPQQPEAVFRP
jgi:hypothetical protein